MKEVQATLTHGIVVRCVLGRKTVEIPQIDAKNLKYIKNKTVPSELLVDRSSRAIIVANMDKAVDDMVFVKLVDNITSDFDFYEILEILNLPMHTIF